MSNAIYTRIFINAQSGSERSYSHENAYHNTKAEDRWGIFGDYIQHDS